MNKPALSSMPVWLPAWRVLTAARPVLPFALLVVALLLPGQSLAQGPHHPFAVGANEGTLGSAAGIGGWILAREAAFYRLLGAAIRAAKEGGMASWGLVALSLAYGIFHAAGPGHGKAVIASYMFANERALRRGIAIAFGAALLQGLSAIAVVGISAIIVKATAQHMRAAVNAVEVASYAAIMLLGAALVYVKAAALLCALRAAPAMAAAGTADNKTPAAGEHCEDHIHGPGCSHFHAPDPSLLGARFSWKSCLLTMIAAGLRPCSGAILVLVFALSQAIFPAGVYAVAAMSLGTAVTTAALASTAVLVKNLAVRYSKAGSRRVALAGRLFELAAALAVLGLGVVLLLGALAGGSGAN